MWQRRGRLLFMQTCERENLSQTRAKMGRWLICKQIRKAFCRVCHCLGNSSRLWTGWYERSWVNRKALNLHRSRIITSRKGWDFWVVRARKSAAFMGNRTILWERFVLVDSSIVVNITRFSDWPNGVNTKAQGEKKKKRLWWENTDDEWKMFLFTREIRVPRHYLRKGGVTPMIQR